MQRLAKPSGRKLRAGSIPAASARMGRHWQGIRSRKPARVKARWGFDSLPIRQTGRLGIGEPKGL